MIRVSEGKRRIYFSKYRRMKQTLLSAGYLKSSMYKRTDIEKNSEPDVH